MPITPEPVAEAQQPPAVPLRRGNEGFLGSTTGLIEPKLPSAVNSIAKFYNQLNSGEVQVANDVSPVTLLNGRAAVAPQNLIRDYPISMSYLTLSRIPQFTLDKMYPGLSTGEKLMVQANAKYPGDRGLLAARARALSVGDPVLSKQLTAMLDNPDIQALLYSDPTLGSDQNQAELSALITAANIGPQAVKSLLGYIALDAPPTQAFRPVSPGQETPTTIPIAGSSLIPVFNYSLTPEEQKVMPTWDVPPGPAGQRMEVALQILAGHPAAFHVRAGGIVGTARGLAADALEGPGQTAMQAIGQVFSLAGKPFELAGHAGQGGGSQFIAMPGLHPVTFNTIGTAGHLLGQGYNDVVGTPSKNLGYLTAHLLGMDPSNPEYEQIANVVSGVTQLAVLHEISGTFRGLRSGGLEVGELPTAEPLRTAWKAQVRDSYGLIGQWMYRARLKTPEEMYVAAGGPGPKAVANVASINERVGAASAANLSAMFPADLARALSVAGTSEPDIAAVMVNASRGAPLLQDTTVAARIASNEAVLAKDAAGVSKLGAGGVTQQMFGRPLPEGVLTADQRFAVQAQLLSDKGLVTDIGRLDEAWTTRPRWGALQRIKGGLPTSPTEQFVEALYNPLVREGKYWGSFPVNLSRWLDPQVTRGTLFDRYARDTPPDGASRTVETVRTSMMRAGVRSSEIQRVIDAYLKYPKSERGFYNWMLDYTGTMADGRLMPANAERLVRLMPERYGSQYYSGYTEYGPDGQPSWKEVTGSYDENGHFLSGTPSRTVDDRNSFPGVDMTNLIEATSMTRKLLGTPKLKALQAETGNWTLRPLVRNPQLSAAYVADKVGATLDWSTAVQKPLALGAAFLRVPAFLMRILPEQFARILTWGGNPFHMGDLRTTVRLIGKVSESDAATYESLAGQAQEIGKLLPTATSEKAYRGLQQRLSTIDEAMQGIEEQYGVISRRYFKKQLTPEQVGHSLLTDYTDARGTGGRILFATRKPGSTEPDPLTSQVHTLEHQRIVSTAEDRSIIRLGPKQWTADIKADEQALADVKARIDPNDPSYKTGDPIRTFADRKYRSIVEQANIGRDANGDLIPSYTMLDALAGGDLFYRGPEVVEKVRQAETPPKGVVESEAARLRREELALKGSQFGGIPRIDETQLQLGETASEVEANLIADDETFRRMITQARQSGDVGATKALAEEWKAARERMYAIEQIAGVKPSMVHANIADARKWASTLDQMYANGDLVPPPYIPLRDDGALSQFKGLARRTNLSTAGELRNRVSQAMYFPLKPVSFLERMWQRFPASAGESQRVYTKLRALGDKVPNGWNDARARSAAEVAGPAFARNVFYDMTKRTPAERQIRNIFWFAPATRNLLSTWFWKIPSRSYWPIGFGILYKEAGALSQVANGLGLVKQITAPDGKKQTVSVIPGLGHLFEMLTGAQGLDTKGFIYPTSLNFLTATYGIPSIAPIPGHVLHDFAIKYPKAFGALDKALNPYGDPQMLPGALLDALYLMGPKGTEIANAIGSLSPRYQQQIYNRSQDTAARIAYTQIGAAPKPEDMFKLTAGQQLTPAQETKFQGALTDWAMRWLDKTKSVLTGTQLFSLMGATISPGRWHTTNADQQAMYRIYAQVGGPPPGPSSSAAAKAYYARRLSIINGYLRQNPAAQAYLTGYTAPGPNFSALLAKQEQETGKFNIYQDLQSGQLAAMPLDQFMARVAYTESRRSYLAQRTSLLAGLGDTWDQVLLNWGDRSNILADSFSEQARWEAEASKTVMPDSTHTFLDPNVAALWAHDLNPTQGTQITAQTQWLTGMINGLTEVEKQLIQSGNSPTSVHDAISQLKGLRYSDANFGVATDPIIAGAAEWFNKVQTPYYDKVLPLEQQAAAALDAGRSGQAANLYDQIRSIKDSYVLNPITIQGKQAPSPEQFRFNMQPTLEQARLTTKWQTEPASWLSAFQMKQAGYGFPMTPQLETFLHQYSGLSQQLQTFIDAAGPKATPTLIQKANQATILAQGQLAQRSGPDAVRIFELDQMTPVQRLSSFGKLTDPNWTSIVNGVNAITSFANSQGVSYHYFNQEVGAAKLLLFQQVDSLVNPTSPTYDKALHADFEHLGLAMAPNGSDMLGGALLYNSLLFSGFNKTFIPPWVISNFGTSLVGGPPPNSGYLGTGSSAPNAPGVVQVPSSWLQPGG